MPDNSFSNEIFPNIYSKPPLTQLEAAASCPVASYLGEETDTCHTTVPFQVFVCPIRIVLWRNFQSPHLYFLFYYYYCFPYSHRASSSTMVNTGNFAVKRKATTKDREERAGRRDMEYAELGI